LDKLTFNRLKINDVDLVNAYEAVEGERALEQAGSLLWLFSPSFSGASSVVF
jgi:hypothetical protein